MKRLLMAQLVLCFFSLPLLAQDVAVSGKITSSEDGAALPGVNISVKGTTRGTSTNAEGTYQLNAPTGSTLVFSFIGFTTQEVPLGNRTTIDVKLVSDAGQLQEVVVTALGIARDRKALNYAVQDIKQEKLNIARDQNVGNALAGKIAGVQVLGQSGAKFGNPSIRIRGVNSLTGSDPLYVVDGTPTDISQVNMDDVETLTVLKGPSASALYGNRASAGVIVISTKRAKVGETRLDINHSTTFDMVSLLPKYQNEYGGGYSQEWETFAYDPAIHPASWASFNGQKILDYSADESWGPRLDGSPHRSAASWQQGPAFGQLTPFSPNPNNVRDFFEKPISNNTNIAFSRGTEAFQSRISYTHIINNGIVPNSSQSRDYVSAKNSIKFADKLTANLNINYTTVRTLNQPADRYGSTGGTTSSTNPLSSFGSFGLGALSNATLSGYNQTIGSFNQWFQRQLSIDDLRNYKNPDGTFRSWNIGGPLDPRPKYWDSPYTQVYENTNTNRSNRLFGDFGVTYQFTTNLKASATMRRDQNNFYQQGRVAIGTLNAGGLGGFSTLAANSVENNYELLVSYNQDFKDLSVVANAGGNIRYNRTDGLFQATQGGLSAPGFYNIAASIDRPLANNYLFQNQVNSVFGNVSLGFRDFVFVEASVRNDWASTLPQANNSYLYPSVSAGLVFTEFVPQNKLLSYGKIRAGYAQVGTDVSPYQLALAYSAGTAYSSNPTAYLPTTLPNNNLQPGLSGSYEAGIDLRFLGSRLGVEFTAYRNENKNQIIPLPVAATSGYSNAVINAGLIQTSGLELHIYANPVRASNGFNWEFDINADRNQTKVVSLVDGLDNYQVDGPQWRTLTLNARTGQDWGALYGQGIKKDPATGKPQIYGSGTNAGLYVKEDNVYLGSVLPKFKGGWLNTFTYKGVVLRVNTDFVVGGKFFSTTKMFNAYSGLAAETAGLNELGNLKRDDPATGGGILLDGITTEGQPNTTRVDAQNLYENWLFGLNERWIYDKTYVKLREVSLGYNLPVRILGKLVKSANISLIARNPLLIYSAIGGGIDISESETIWYEGGQLPPVRSYGINVRLGF